MTPTPRVNDPPHSVWTLGTFWGPNTHRNNPVQATTTREWKLFPSTHPHPILFFPPVYYITSRRRRIQHWAEIAEVIDRVILGEKWSWPVVASSITKYHWRGGRRAWCWAQTRGDWWWAAGGEGRGPAPQRLSTRCPPSLSPLIGSDIFIRIAAARPVTSPCRHAIMPIIIMLHQHHYPPTNPRPAGGGL